MITQSQIGNTVFIHSFLLKIMSTKMKWKNHGPRSETWSFNLSSAIYLLCDLGYVTQSDSIVKGDQHLFQNYCENKINGVNKSVKWYSTIKCSLF